MDVTTPKESFPSAEISEEKLLDTQVPEDRLPNAPMLKEQSSDTEQLPNASQVQESRY
ncbi:hypothetical protein X471_01053 [Bartonella bacilliformis str. Heidi Mejia]|uniref:hypothetical protein n=1 Tax=Bartonella bacilliformis TaxID=774 RepID=UPI000446FF19|nr:hypothetical protein [Bartonella bacilliformis]EYS90919.1 hypothetical protein X471_01053 [Bartonella bacilliformis str. Heidi Mejia]KEG17503.1 hypothetical protein H707_01139 [Bartonella bacilliformis Hosp800-02]KEG21888.1 hypothetical protein H708_01142 [Bartonella bacilliformis VAB9028]KEG23263.1 hypothetical protein H706_01152 [Bartonella bacilliformis CAR600-02]KEG15760.1 hypothetical protein H705_01189 [Bartonella bacilliformis Cond044]